VRNNAFVPFPGTYSSARKRASETWPGYYRTSLAGLSTPGAAAQKEALSSQQSALSTSSLTSPAGKFLLTERRTNGTVDYFRRGEKKLQADDL
jgi:hypothetical protein